MSEDIIKVGEYIRTRNGLIFKVDKQFVNIEINEFQNIAGERDIKRHSKNIIDLIEVGDYVNGYKVSATNKKYIETDTNNCDCKEGMPWLIENTEIKSIVTKEQYKEMEYRV